MKGSWSTGCGLRVIGVTIGVVIMCSWGSLRDRR
jgi:hypothetical protein